jgi:hypothetical protein
MQIWTDHEGQPADTRDIQSYLGPEHCDWQSMTFLQLGDRTYVRDVLPELRSYVDHPYVAHTALPSDAFATGYSRDGRHVWLAADDRTAYVGADREDVEAWPIEVRPLGCA